MVFMRKQILLLFLLTGSVAFSQKNLAAEDFFAFKDSAEKVVVLDVRIYEEFSSERIPGALYAGEKEVLLKLISGYPKELLVLVYCTYGNRSKKVLTILEKEGFLNVYHLKRGFKDWKDKGFPVDDSDIY
jgi:hydroxyacylglutathione hydrolase